MSKEVRDAERRGDVQAVKRLLKKREQISQVIDKEKLQQLRNEGEKSGIFLLWTFTKSFQNLFRPIAFRMIWAQLMRRKSLLRQRHTIRIANNGKFASVHT